MTTPAGDLVRAFADVDRMDAMYADEIVWTLPASLGPAAGPHHGREAVVAFNRAVWGQYYSPEGVEVEVVEELREPLHALRSIIRWPDRRGPRGSRHAETNPFPGAADAAARGSGLRACDHDSRWCPRG